MRHDKTPIAAIAVIILILLAGMTMLAKVRQRTPEARTQAEIQAAMGKPVQTATVSVGDIEQTVSVTGDIKALTEVSLSAKASGRVAAVLAREGDVVRAGQTLVRLDSTEAESTVRAAEAGLSAARARLSQAITTAEATERQADAAIAQARAGLEIAQAQLAVVKQGARSQERLVAQNAVNTAKASLDNAEANLQRYETLYRQGAVSAQQLDTYRTQRDIAKAQHDSALQQLSLIREGARPEDITSAENQVKQAREALRTANANASQVNIRREDIKSARAGVEQAQAALQAARQQLDYTNIATTTSGVVATRSVEAGQTANAGQTLMTVVDLGNMFFEANLSDRELANVRAGQPVRVSVDAIPGRQFLGRVAKILPVASEASRNFTVRIQAPNPRGELRPGMFARGAISVKVQENALLVPKDAIVQQFGDTMVFVADGAKAKMVNVRLGIDGDRQAQILEPTELKAGDRVVTAGRQGLQDGAKIHVEKS